MAGKLGIGVGALGAEGLAAYLRPVVGVILIIADVAIPSIVGVVLLAVILRGSQNTCDRVFRLLLWIANRPEPPAPEAGERRRLNEPERLLADAMSKAETVIL